MPLRESPRRFQGDPRRPDRLVSEDFSKKAGRAALTLQRRETRFRSNQLLGGHDGLLALRFSDSWTSRETSQVTKISIATALEEYQFAAENAGSTLLRHGIGADIGSEAFPHGGAEFAEGPQSL